MGMRGGLARAPGWAVVPLWRWDDRRMRMESACGHVHTEFHLGRAQFEGLKAIEAV